MNVTELALRVWIGLYYVRIWYSGTLWCTW